MVTPAVRVEVLFTPGCPHAAVAEGMLRSILGEQALAGKVERIPIADFDHAAGLGFRGSPTVRVDGVDVAPEPNAEISLACRRYRHPDATFRGYPSGSDVRAALRARVDELRPGPGIRAQARRLPESVMRAGFVWASQQPALGSLTARLPLTRGLVRRFVAGEDLAAVLDVVGRLNDARLATTVDVLGESVDSEARASVAADRYLALLEALAERDLEGNVSLKLTQMGLDIDEAFCRRNAGRIVERARALGAFVRIDMEDHPRTDATLSIARELFARHGNVGVVIQSYLRRSADDVEALIGERIRVRLCKGAYNEPARVAFPSKDEVDESYVALARRLLSGGTYPGLATHDERIIDRCRAFVAEQGIARDRYEFQMLYGVRRDLQEALVATGETVRVYVPYGHDWYPYFMRRLAERPANVLFVLRNIMREGRH